MSASGALAARPVLVRATKTRATDIGWLAVGLLLENCSWIAPFAWLLFWNADLQIAQPIQKREAIHDRLNPRLTGSDVGGATDATLFWRQFWKGISDIAPAYVDVARDRRCRQFPDCLP
jgi:hypothetical protein